jgi:hypothetical protein
MQKCKVKTPVMVRKGKGKKTRNLRLGVGLGAAGLASGFAASHFEGIWGWVVKLGGKGAGS